MRGWYDIVTLDREQFVHDIEGINESAEFVGQLIEEELRLGIPAAKIILVGFSQGGAIALYAGLTSRHALGGIIGLSTYLPAPDTLQETRSAHRPPILMQHGSKDEIIHLAYAELSCEKLREMGYQIEFDVYPMGHSICGPLLDRIRTWMCGILEIHSVFKEEK